MVTVCEFLSPECNQCGSVCLCEVKSLSFGELVECCVLLVVVVVVVVVQVAVAASLDRRLRQ